MNTDIMHGCFQLPQLSGLLVVLLSLSPAHTFKSVQVKVQDEVYTDSDVGLIIIPELPDDSTP